MIKKERVFLWVGIILTVISIIITHSIVGKINNQINEYQILIAKSEKQIDLLWQRQQGIENRSAISYLLGIDKNNDVVQNFIDDTISYFDISDRDKLELNDLQIISKYTKIHQQKTINAIDDVYLEKESVARRLYDLQQQHELIQALALFLHVIGLVLVLYYRG